MGINRSAVLGCAVAALVIISCMGFCTKYERRVRFVSEGQPNPVIAQTRDWPAGHPSVRDDVLTYVSVFLNDENVNNNRVRIELACYLKSPASSDRLLTYMVTCRDLASNSLLLSDENAMIMIRQSQDVASWTSMPFDLRGANGLVVEILLKEDALDGLGVPIRVRFERSISRWSWRGLEV